MTAVPASPAASQQAAVDAALLVLKSMGLSLEDLTAARGQRPAVPTCTGPVTVPGPAVAADRTGTARDQARTVRSWPLLLLAFPAAAEVWSGWVGRCSRPGKPCRGPGGTPAPGSGTAATAAAHHRNGRRAWYGAAPPASRLLRTRGQGRPAAGPDPGDHCGPPCGRNPRARRKACPALRAPPGNPDRRYREHGNGHLPALLQRPLSPPP